MAISDQIVLETLQKILADKPPGQPITYKEISEAMPRIALHIRTIGRSMARLEVTGEIKRFGGGTSTGYRYIINETRSSN